MAATTALNYDLGQQIEAKFWTLSTREQIAAWRRMETRLRTLRLTGTKAAIERAEFTMARWAHVLDCAGHQGLAADLAREAILAPMVRARREAGVVDTDLSDKLARVRARIRAAR